MQLRDTEGQLVEAKQEVGVKDTTITTLRQELV